MSVLHKICDAFERNTNFLACNNNLLPLSASTISVDEPLTILGYAICSARMPRTLPISYRVVFDDQIRYYMFCEALSNNY
jgi:hypothetical protein